MKKFCGCPTLGVIGVQMGTWFIATQECEFDEKWKQHSVTYSDGDSLVARGFFGPMRFLRNFQAIKMGYTTIRGVSDLFKGIPTRSTQEILDLEVNG